MKKKALIISGVALVVVIGGGYALLRHMGPYGPQYLPQWELAGAELVKAVESHREKNGELPQQLPVQPDLSKIPGCKSVNYFVKEEGGKPYYRIEMRIHLREIVMYDSRMNLSEADSWGEYEIRNGWMWTKD